MSKDKDLKIKELEDRIVLLEKEIADKESVNVKNIETNEKLQELVTSYNQKVIKLESQLATYEKIFTKKDKQFERQYKFVQEYRSGLIALGKAYQEKGICDNGAIEKLIESMDEMTSKYKDSIKSDKDLLSEVKKNG